MDDQVIQDTLMMKRLRTVIYCMMGVTLCLIVAVSIIT